ncbi:MAG: beta-lactamase family protein [Caulobacteraceae bacterium]|nr:beta-lactamase family protein [Caulobacteraceae bacterium]
MTMIDDRGVSRRAFVGAGGALMFSGMAGPGKAAEGPAAAWAAAYNSGDAAVISRWAAQAFSPAGLNRRSADQWGSLLASSIPRTGQIRVQEATPHGADVRAQLSATGLPTVRYIDFRADRDQPAKLFDLRQVAEPTPYPSPLVFDRNRAGLGAQVRRLIDFAIENNDFSGSIEVRAPDGSVIHQSVNGWANREKKRQLDDQTPMNLGSCDKSFTALMIGQLVQEKRLGFDQTLAEALPDYPNREQPSGITLRQLLTPKSGLGDPKGGLRTYSSAPYTRVSDLLPAIAATPSAFAAGARPQYSNEGYVVLGAVIERVTGQTYWDALAQRIYAPAGMTKSGHFTRPEAIERCALGYLFRSDDLFLADGRVSNAEELPWRGNSCGGGYSTAADINRYFAALNAGRLLPHAALEAMWAKTGEPNPGMGYGMGFIHEDIGGKTLIGHSGGGAASGVGTDLRMVAQNGWSFAVLGNYDLQYSEGLTQAISSLVAAQA